jgi:hypothetical protein
MNRRLFCFLLNWMKYIISLMTFMSLILACKAQGNNYDSLRKYSYFVYGLYNENPLAGTALMADGSGYFYRKDGMLFFVSAKHVLSGCNSNGVSYHRTSNYPSQLAILLNDSNGHASNGVVYINTQKIMDTCNCPPDTLEPDVISIYIPSTSIPNGYPVFSVENFKQIDDFKKDKKISIFGFPTDERVSGNNCDYTKDASHIFIEDYRIKDIENYENNKKVYIDSIEYRIFPKTIISYEKMKGYSGSPVFVKYRRRWYLLGTITGLLDENSYIVLKTHYMLKTIRSDN